jgi:3-dehydroquinate synthase
MLRTVRLSLKKRSYDIVIGQHAINSLGRRLKKLRLGPDAYIITTLPIKRRFGRQLSCLLQQNGFKLKFKLVPEGEGSKSITIASDIIRDLALYDKKRRIFIIALGGGVIGDISGFVASIYKRGVPYIQVPTTLLAQVDSSIGGKTAVDLTQGKNLVGAFYQPRLVISDTGFLKSLDLRQLRSGLAEVIKYGIIRDPVLFKYLESHCKDILGRNASSLDYIVARSSAIKAKIVRQDEREEKSIRTILNFGHTMAHAIEAAGGYRGYNHGEAVALGMLVACEISRKLSLMNERAFLRVENLIRNIGLPLKIKGLSAAKIIRSHYRDKKFSGARNRFVLSEGLGRTKIREGLALNLIKEALQERMF